MDEKVILPSGEEISKEFYDKLMSVTGKRARFVIDKIMKDGSCSTEDLKDAAMCEKCYYAFPENYDHIAGEEERRLDIMFRKSEIDIYETICDRARKENISIQEAFKRIVAESEK